jgi:chromosome partitioning protein
MKTIAVIAQKGGSGKTTLSLNLAVAIEGEGKEVAIIDLDQQASASGWGDSRESGSPAVVSAHAARLPQLLEKCKENGADFVILDTAPHAENQALAAARAADIILIPCRPSLVDLRAISSSVNIARIAEKPAYVVVSQKPARGSLVTEAVDAAKELGVEVAPVEIGNRIAFVHAFTAGEGVTEYESNGKAAEEIKQLYQFINKVIKE